MLYNHNIAMGPKQNLEGHSILKLSLDITLPILTDCVLPVRYEASQKSASPLTPNMIEVLTVACCDQQYQRLQINQEKPSMPIADYQPPSLNRSLFSTVQFLCYAVFYMKTDIDKL